MEAQVAAKHEIEDHKEVLVILKGIAQVAHERRVYFFKHTSLLDDIGHCMLFDTSCKGADCATVDAVSVAASVLQLQCLRCLLMYFKAYSCFVCLC